MSPVIQRLADVFEGQWRPECVICRESVELEETKVDEHGQAIHEQCYVSKLVGKKITEEKHFMKLLITFDLL